MLETQINERKVRDKAEIERLKEKVRTNYGPEESEKAYQFNIEKEI